MHSPSLLSGKSLPIVVTALMMALMMALLTGCVTLTQQDRQVLLDHKVPAPLYEKMLHREVLELSEIAQLSARRVPPEFIIHYIDNSLAEYHLTTDDVLVLRSVGVNDKVIDFLLSTASGMPVVVNRYPYWPPTYTRTVIIHHHHRRR